MNPYESDMLSTRVDDRNSKGRFTMKFTHLAVLSAALLCAPQINSAFAADKPAKAAPAATASATAKAKNTPEATALFKEISAVKTPKPDMSKRNDKAYVDSFKEQLRTAATKRLELTKQFIGQFPDDTRKADVLFMQANDLAMIGKDADAFKETVAAFLEAAPKDDRGAMLLLQTVALEKDDDKQLDIYRRIVKEYPRSQAAQQSKQPIARAEAIGKPFKLNFKDAISGKAMSIEGLKGKVVVIDFWATWCGPCVAEMPHMKELYAEYKDKGVEFIGVSLDAPPSQGGLKSLKEFVATNGMTWPQYYQGNGWDSPFSKNLGINSIPAVYVVDAKGNLHSTKARGKLETILPELLEGSPKEPAPKEASAKSGTEKTPAGAPAATPATDENTGL
jgi:thiol-disulfide isomerase/thioredoxin